MNAPRNCISLRRDAAQAVTCRRLQQTSFFSHSCMKGLAWHADQEESGLRSH